eukprot:Em0009g1262a
MWLATASWILHLFVGLRSFRFLRNILFPNQITELERHADQVQSDWNTSKFKMRAKHILPCKRSAVLRALNLIEELGPHIGLVINFSKCEVFSPQGNHLFPPAVKSSLSPNLEILGVPIGDYLHCSHFIAENCSKAKVLFPALVEVAEADLHVAVSLLRICGSYCKLVHLARTTPPSLSCESLKFFDEECHADMVGMLSSDTIACETSLLSFVAVLTYLTRVILQVLQLTKQSAESTPKVSGAGVRVCFPLAVESYGNWGKEAQNTFARLASILSISLHCPKAKVLIEIYGRLNISLVRSVACLEDAVFQDPQMTSLLPEWPYSSSLQDPQMTSLLPEWPYSSSLRDPQMTSLLPEWLYSSSLRDPQMTSLLPEWPYSSSLRDPQMTTKG